MTTSVAMFFGGVILGHGLVSGMFAIREVKAYGFDRSAVKMVAWSAAWTVIGAATMAMAFVVVSQ